MTPRYPIFEVLNGGALRRGILCAAVAVGLSASFAAAQGGGAGGQQDRPGAQPGGQQDRAGQQPGGQQDRPGQQPGGQQQPGMDRQGAGQDGIQQALARASTIQLQQGQTPHVVVLFPMQQRNTSPRGMGGMAGGAAPGGVAAERPGAVGQPQVAGGREGGDLQIVFVSGAGQGAQQPGATGRDAAGADGGQPAGAVGGQQDRAGAGAAGNAQQDRPGGMAGAGQAGGMGGQTAEAVVLSADNSFDGVASFVMQHAQNSVRVAAMRNGQPVQLQQVSQQGGVHVFIVSGGAAAGGAGGRALGGSSGQNAEAVIVVYLGKGQDAAAQPAGGQQPGQQPGAGQQPAEGQRPGDGMGGGQ